MGNERRKLVYLLFTNLSFYSRLSLPTVFLIPLLSADRAGIWGVLSKLTKIPKIVEDPLISSIFKGNRFQNLPLNILQTIEY